jgi:hypothetical protein
MKTHQINLKINQHFLFHYPKYHPLSLLKYDALHENSRNQKVWKDQKRLRGSREKKMTGQQIQRNHVQPSNSLTFLILYLLLKC